MESLNTKSLAKVKGSSILSHRISTVNTLGTSINETEMFWNRHIFDYNKINNNPPPFPCHTKTWILTKFFDTSCQTFTFLSHTLNSQLRKISYSLPIGRSLFSANHSPRSSFDRCNLPLHLSVIFAHFAFTALLCFPYSFLFKVVWLV